MAYYVYMVTNREDGTIYVGVTGNLVRRIYEHKTKPVAGFTKRYNLDKLVYFEVYESPVPAIQREKNIKHWRRDWKIALIEGENSDWRDLYPEIASGYISRQ